MAGSKPHVCERVQDVPKQIMQPILESQKVKFRHKCGGCLYEAGIEEGIRRQKAGDARKDAK
jgi:hypothetical protein